MPVTLYQHTDAAESLWRTGIRQLRQYAQAAAAAAAELPAGEEREDAAAIADALVADMPGGKLTAGRIPAADVRHITPLSGAVRRISEEIHGSDPGTLCPMLAAEGFTPESAYMLPRLQNGRQAADMRATSHRCPYCLAADVVRTLRRDGASARDADARWNRRGS